MSTISNPTDLKLLELLQVSVPVTERPFGELAKQLGVGESAATAVVDRLVRQGLVLRRDDPSDRRVVRLALSDEGHSVVTELHKRACSKTAGLLSVLSDDQLGQLVGIMETLDQAANEMSIRFKTAAHDNKHKEQL